MSRASQRNALLIQHCYSPYRTTQFEKTIKKRQKGPVLAIKGPFGDLGGPRRALGGQIWSQRPPIGQSGLESCSPHTLTWYGAPSGSLGALKETVLARNAPFGGPGGPRRAPGGQIWSQLPPIGPPGLDSWSPHTLTWYRTLSTAQFLSGCIVYQPLITCTIFIRAPANYRVVHLVIL